MQQKNVTCSEANTTFTTLPPNESMNLPTCTLYIFKVPKHILVPIQHSVKFSPKMLRQARGWISVMLGQHGVGSVSRVLHSRIFSPGGNLCGNKLAPLHPHQAQILLPELCFSHLWSWTIGEDFIFNEWTSFSVQGNWLSPIELFSKTFCFFSLHETLVNCPFPKV